MFLNMLELMGLIQIILKINFLFVTYNKKTKNNLGLSAYLVEFSISFGEHAETGVAGSAFWQQLRMSPAEMGRLIANQSINAM